MGFKDRITKVISSPKIDENDMEELINKGLKEIALKKDIGLTKTTNINTDNITIDGKNHVITSNREQIFNITGDNITLKNITFKNAHPNQAGSAVYNRNGKLRVIECNFINNHSARDNGGSIYNENSKLIIEKCRFTRDGFNNNFIYLENGKSHIKSSQFLIKREHEDSYIIYNENATVKVENLEFENVSNKLIYNNNIMEIEREIKDYVKSGNDSLNIKYL